MLVSQHGLLCFSFPTLLPLHLHPPPTMELPQLSDDALRYPDFCLSISTGLVHLLSSILNSCTADHQPTLVLSVGSGSGLLEAHLDAHWSEDPDCHIAIEGVEVRATDDAKSVNKYLPEDRQSTVRGTWEVSPRLGQAGALMFVYPREPGLVAKYIQTVQEIPNGPLTIAVWLGPKADWESFEEYFANVPGFGKPEVLQGFGMAEFEMMAYIRKHVEW